MQPLPVRATSEGFIRAAGVQGLRGDVEVSQQDNRALMRQEQQQALP
jgi:hypothetical protein